MIDIEFLSVLVHSSAYNALYFNIFYWLLWAKRNHAEFLIGFQGIRVGYVDKILLSYKILSSLLFELVYFEKLYYKSAHK